MIHPTKDDQIIEEKLEQIDLSLIDIKNRLNNIEERLSRLE